MRKTPLETLYSTTALVAVGAFIGIGAAQADEMMAEPVSVSISGGYQVALGTMNAAADNETTLHTNFAPAISGSATMDNGLTFGVSVAMYTLGSPSLVLYQRGINIGGSFGDVQAGQVRSARGQMRIAAPSVTGSFGVNGPWFAGSANTVATNDPLDGANRDAKLVYMSPHVGGIQIGLSYAPTGTDLNEQIAAGATFTQNIAGGSVSINAGYETGGAMMSDSTVLNAGASFTIDNITIGGGMKRGENLMGKEVQEMDVGASLAMGSLTVGAQWASKDDTLVDTNMFALGGAYPLGTGVALEAQLDFNDDGTDDWVQLMIGTAINF